MSQEIKPRLSIIIPAYNEEKRLPHTLTLINDYMVKVDFPYEIIIVDNNSKDGTAEVVHRFSHIMKNLRLVECKTPGKGAAVKTGMLEAKGEIRVFTDSDNSISIDQIVAALDHFKDGVYGVVIGSRDIEGKSKNDQPWYRQISGNIGNLIIQTLLLPGIWDTQCPLKAFTEKSAIDVFSKSKVTRWGFDVEILSLAKKMGYKIKEIPAIFINDTDSKVKLSTYIDVLLEVFKIRLWLWFGAYKIKK